MKQKEIRELHHLGEEELKTKARELKEKLAKAKLDLASKKIKNYRLIITLNDEIARVLTVVREKELKI